jgi:hypothetical protein
MAAKSTTITVNLDYPITVAGAEVSFLTVRRPKGRDIFRFQDAEAKGISEGQRTKQMLCDLCEVGPDVLDELDASDLNRLGEIVGSFTNPQSTTSAGQS